MNSLPTFQNREHVEFAHCQWPAEPHQLARIRATVRDWLAPLPLTDGAREDLLLAINEAATNAVEHAYPEPSPPGLVEIVFWAKPHRVETTVVDHGRWRPPPALPGYRGRGITLMQRLVDSVIIHFGSSGTRVLLSHALPGTARGLPDEAEPTTEPPAALSTEPPAALRPQGEHP
jgi:anti-sigma regulatory factor (Ser/Thr protein kinase)